MTTPTPGENARQLDDADREIFGQTLRELISNSTVTASLDDEVIGTTEHREYAVVNKAKSLKTEAGNRFRKAFAVVRNQPRRVRRFYENHEDGLVLLGWSIIAFVGGGVLGYITALLVSSALIALGLTNLAVVGMISSLLATLLCAVIGYKVGKYVFDPERG